MADKNMRDIIVDAFVDSVSASSLAKVRVSALIKQLGINRNTFYYYFANKYETALWAFENDLARELTATCKPFSLVYLPEGDAVGKPEEPLPYYARVQTGAHSLDNSCFLRALVRTLRRNERFYGKLFDEREIEFGHAFLDRYRPAVEEDLRFILGGRYLPQSTFDFLAGQGAHYIMFCARAVFSIRGETEDILDERINPFWNMYLEAVSEAIQRHPVNRINRARRRSR